MKPLDKALLTQELSELIQSLKDGNLSYFDHARSKQRILEIQEICEQLLHNQLFKQQQQQLEPLLYAQDFVYESRYREFCCGVFTEDQTLEDILYQQQHSTWALLYEPNEGWQIWLLQMPNQTLLISDSGDLETVYAWLISQQMKYQCFHPNTAPASSEEYTVVTPIEETTPVSEAAAVPTHNHFTHTENSYQAQLNTINQAAEIPTSHLPDLFKESTKQQIQKRVLQQSSFDSSVPPSPKISRLLRKQETDISEGLSFDLGLELLDLSNEKPIHIPPRFSAPEPNITKVEQEPHFEMFEFKQPQAHAEIQQDLSLFERAQFQANKPKPKTTIQASIAEKELPDPFIEVSEPAIKRTTTALPRTKKPEHPTQLVLNGFNCAVSALASIDAKEKQLYRLTPEQIKCEHIDLLLHHQEHDHVLQRPVYLAEQVDARGCFVKYLALFGAQGELQAIRLAHIFSHLQGHKLVAVRSIDWPNLQSHLFDADALFHTYDALAQLIWSQKDYYPFIPAALIQTQKFIQFIETPAKSQTPILLLKERQKIRVIHGDNRLNLALNETAYPYLLLDRQQGLSWQLIQEVIQSLNQPIDVLTLHKALSMQAL